jgi:PPOX class probable F420-dependent enzyme
MTSAASWAWRAFADARIARLATANADGQPRIAPFTFVLVGDPDRVFFAVDGKPKSGKRLARLRDIDANPAVSALVDHYAEDWSALWWVRADGTARIHEDGAAVELAHRLLAEKYSQYREVALGAPVVEITVTNWGSWSYS